MLIWLVKARARLFPPKTNSQTRGMAWGEPVNQRLVSAKPTSTTRTQQFRREFRSSKDKKMCRRLLTGMHGELRWMEKRKKNKQIVSFDSKHAASLPIHHRIPLLRSRRDSAVFPATLSISSAAPNSINFQLSLPVARGWGYRVRPKG